MRLSFLTIFVIFAASCTVVPQSSEAQTSNEDTPNSNLAPIAAPTVSQVEDAKFIDVTTHHRGEIGTAPKADNDPRPFDKDRDASSDVDATLFAARKADKNSLIVLGANWCHDSRALAGHFAKQRFQTLIDREYELVYVDTGQKDRNVDIAQRFGLDSIEGTPTVFIVSPDGEVLNLDSAPTWRHAATMEEDDVHRYFRDFAKAARDAR